MERKKDCEAAVLQAMEAIEDRNEEKFTEILYPISRREWKKETGESALPTAKQLRRALAETEDYGFSLPYKIENLYIIEDYYGRNWYESHQIPVRSAVNAAVYWAATEKRTTCAAWPVSFQCLYIEHTWYLNPYWVLEYLNP